MALSSTSSRRLQCLLAECLAAGGSDLHLTAGDPPYIRIHGILEPMEEAAVSAEEMEQLAHLLLKERGHTALDHNLDGSLSAEDGTRFRYNLYRRQGTYALALRRLEEAFKSLAELGLPDSLYDLCDLTEGLIVLAGPTGAGKSTTLATLVNRINRTRRCHILTIEDPVEYLHHNQMSLVNQLQVGTDCPSFNAALVASLRQDPDVILVGEIRDLHTIRTAITAAETGHLVLTTVHASDCVSTIERLVAVFPAGEQDGIRRQLSLVLRAIITQHLVVADGPRARPKEPEARRQRVVTSEVLRLNSAVANLIVQAKSAQIYSAMETGSAQGMQTLEQDLARLVTTGKLRQQSALALTRNPRLLRDRLSSMSHGLYANQGGLR